MFVQYNPNPMQKNVGDCTVRAISKAMNKSWNEVYTELCAKGFELCDMPDSNAVWGAYLLANGYKRFMLPEVCPMCYTIADFAAEHTEGTFIVGTGSHVVCISEGGKIFDSWDSSDRMPIYYFMKEEGAQNEL